jgi:hypothetical protein
MTEPKGKKNWFYLTLGMLFILSFLWTDKINIQENDLETRTIIVSHDIQYTGGRRSKFEYRLGSTEYPCSFVIKSAGALAAKWTNLENTIKNDTLIIKIHTNRLQDLNKKTEDIPIYSLIKNNKLVYDTDGYNISQKTIDRRWSLIFIIIGILFILRGLTIISSKTSYILSGLSIIVMITLRLLNIW